MIACVDDREKTTCAFHLQAREASIAVSGKATITMTITVGVAVDADGRNSPPTSPSFLNLPTLTPPCCTPVLTSMIITRPACESHGVYVYTPSPRVCVDATVTRRSWNVVSCVPYVLTFCETRAHDAGNVSVEPRATLVMLVGVMHGACDPTPCHAQCRCD